MKLLLVTSLLITSTAFAYTSSPSSNHPVKDPAWMPDKREPASVEVKAPKQEKVHDKKSWEQKK